MGLVVIRGSREEDGAGEEQANARPQLRMTGLSFLCRNAGLCTRGKSSAMHTHAHTHTHTHTHTPVPRTVSLHLCLSPHLPHTYTLAHHCHKTMRLQSEPRIECPPPLAPPPLPQLAQETGAAGNSQFSLGPGRAWS